MEFVFYRMKVDLCDDFDGVTIIKGVGHRWVSNLISDQKWKVRQNHEIENATIRF